MVINGNKWKSHFSKKARVAARRQIAAQGKALTEWCREKGVSYTATIDVLRGKTRGTIGDAHRAAVALGLKEEWTWDEAVHHSPELQARVAEKERGL